MNNTSEALPDIERFKSLTLQQQAGLLWKYGEFIGAANLDGKRVAHYRIGRLSISVESVPSSPILLSINAQVTFHDEQ
jgi:hypothetical protein